MDIGASCSVQLVNTSLDVSVLSSDEEERVAIRRLNKREVGNYPYPKYTRYRNNEPRPAIDMTRRPKNGSNSSED